MALSFVLNFCILFLWSAATADALYNITAFSSVQPSQRQRNHNVTVHFAVRMPEAAGIVANTTCGASWRANSTDYPKRYEACADGKSAWYIAEYHSINNMTLHLTHTYDDDSVGQGYATSTFAEGQITKDMLDCAYAASGAYRCRHAAKEPPISLKIYMIVS